MRIPSGVTDQFIYFVAVDATDFATRETGLSSFTVYRSRNGGAAAAMTTPTINETDTTNMPGVYELLLDEDTTIDAGDDSQEMVFHITHAGMAPVTRTIEIYRPKITAGNTLGVASDGDISGNVDGNVAGSVASVTGAVGSVTGAVGSVTAAVTLPTIPAAWITADGVATDAIGAAELAADAVAEIADAVLDEALSGHATGGTLGKAVADIETDTNELQGDWTNGGRLDLIIDAILTDTGTTLPAGLAAIETDTQDLQLRTPAALVGGRTDSNVGAINASTIAPVNLAASALGIVPGICEGTPTTTVIQTDLAETTDDHYIGRVVVFTSGNASGQASDITDYTGSTGTITVTALTTEPVASDTFVIV